MYSLSDFDFNLPQERIAQFPLPDRSASRLLHLDGEQIIDRQFADIVGLLQPGDLLVMNDTRVLKARFFGVKESGGKIEALVERVLDNRTVLAQVRASKSPGPGVKIRLADAFDVTVGERAGEFYTLHFDADVFDLIEAHGRLPLPPYIEHDADSFDETRYQTVFNKVPGAVAAPTAGLHFDEKLLAELKAKGINFAYVTLHVGAGTFQPVR
ncbi:MAG: S-adenosylmethionine:tRNA ribosyltransferase-isomerase, partial [Pseudomonadota bacterium]